MRQLHPLIAVSHRRLSSPSLVAGPLRRPGRKRREKRTDCQPSVCALSEVVPKPTGSLRSLGPLQTRTALRKRRSATGSTKLSHRKRLKSLLRRGTTIYVLQRRDTARAQAKKAHFPLLRHTLLSTFASKQPFRNIISHEKNAYASPALCRNTHGLCPSSSR